MSSKTVSILSMICKGLALLSGLAAYQQYIPQQYGKYAVIAFLVISFSKDCIRSIGDKLDDGVSNNSFK